MNVSSLWPIAEGSLSSQSFASSLPSLSVTFSANSVQSSDGGTQIPPFCTSWASELLRLKSNPLSLKRSIQQRVLAIVKEINIMQRLLGTAESHHYALFNAYQFLRSCSTVPSVLLASALVSRDEADSMSNHSQVLTVLGEFVQEKIGSDWFLNFPLNT